MSLATKFQAALAVVLAAALMAGCATYDPASSAAGVKVKTHEFNGIEFVWMPPGSCQMGSPVDEAGRDSDEGPVHPVVFEDGFWISRSEITQHQYEMIMKENPSAVKREDKPVSNVSWLDAMEFCLKLSADSGGEYRLPTEAEWEYAARAGTSTVYYFGDDPLLLKAYEWYAANTPGKEVQFVEQKAPNRWGLYDTLGNLSEWCYDVYAEDYYGQSPMECPAGPEEGVMRSIRGGSIKSTAEECRIADRECADPEAKSPTMGFRIVRDELPTWPKYYRPIETEEAEE